MAAEDFATNEVQFTDEMILLLAARIRALRIAKGYKNYEKFANDHNLARAQYGRYEKGADLQFSSLLKLLIAFNISIEEFFSEGFNNNKPH